MKLKTIVLMLCLASIAFGQSTKKVVHSDWMKAGAVYGYPDSTNMPAGPMRDSIHQATDSAAMAIILTTGQLKLSDSTFIGKDPPRQYPVWLPADGRGITGEARHTLEVQDGITVFPHTTNYQSTLTLLSKLGANGQVQWAAMDTGGVYRFLWFTGHDVGSGTYPNSDTYHRDGLPTVFIMHAYANRHTSGLSDHMAVVSDTITYSSNEMLFPGMTLIGGTVPGGGYLTVSSPGGNYPGMSLGFPSSKPVLQLRRGSTDSTNDYIHFTHGAGGYPVFTITSNADLLWYTVNSGLSPFTGYGWKIINQDNSSRNHPVMQAGSLRVEVDDTNNTTNYLDVLPYRTYTNKKINASSYELAIDSLFGIRSSGRGRFSDVYSDYGIILENGSVIKRLVLNDSGSGLILQDTTFSPTHINGLALWLDGSDITTMFKDTNATDPVTSDGDTIKAWVDKGGSGRKVKQVTNTTGEAPLYKTNILNSKSIVRGDGVDDALMITGFPTDTVRTVFIVATKRSLPVQRQTLFSQGTYPSQEGYAKIYTDTVFSSGLALYGLSSCGECVFNITDTVTTTQIYELNYSSSKVLDIKTNNASPLGGVTLLDSVWSTYTTLTLFDDSLGNYSDYDIAEVLVWNKSLTKTQSTRMYNYLDDKWRGSGIWANPSAGVDVGAVVDSARAASKADSVTSGNYAKKNLDATQFTNSTGTGKVVGNINPTFTAPATTHSYVTVDNTTGGYASAVTFKDAGSSKWSIGLNKITVASTLDFYSDAYSIPIMTIHPSLGDVATVGNYKSKMWSGALTDGTPTAAEITGIIGLAPNHAAIGAGWEAWLKDTDGTSLMYRVVSDGTSWWTYSGTVAP